MTDKEINQKLKQWGVKSEIQRQLMGEMILCYAESAACQDGKKLRDMMEDVGEKFSMTPEQVYNRLRLGVKQAAKSTNPGAKSLFKLRGRGSLGIYSFIERFFTLYIFPEFLEEGLRAVFQKVQEWKEANGICGKSSGSAARR